MMTETQQAAPWKPATFEEWVTYAPTQYLKCWDQGHRYTEWLGQNADWRKDGSVMLYQVCPNCGLPRDRWIGAAGEIDGKQNTYYYHRMTQHPYPYLFRERGPFGQGVRERRARIRLELKRRTLLGQTVPDRPGTTPATTVRFTG